jgi:hypothetical protein
MPVSLWACFFLCKIFLPFSKKVPYRFSEIVTIYKMIHVATFKWWLFWQSFLPGMAQESLVRPAAQHLLRWLSGWQWSLLASPQIQSLCSVEVTLLLFFTHSCLQLISAHSNGHPVMVITIIHVPTTMANSLSAVTQGHYLGCIPELIVGVLSCPITSHTVGRSPEPRVKSARSGARYPLEAEDQHGCSRLDWDLELEATWVLETGASKPDSIL